MGYCQSPFLKQFKEIFQLNMASAYLGNVTNDKCEGLHNHN